MSEPTGSASISGLLAAFARERTWLLPALLGFSAQESCGKCTPCREGAPWLLEMLRALARGPDAEARVRALGETIQLASRGGLGQAAPQSVLRARETFPAALRIGHDRLAGRDRVRARPGHRALVRHPHGHGHRARLLARPSTGA